MTDSPLAPVAVFAYRRVRELSLTLDALERCPEFAKSPVFVFSDGPASSDSAGDVAAVRACVRSRLRQNMRLIESAENLGLAASIERGATSLAADFGKFIVIEDDLVVAPCALTWLNSGLTEFGASPEVWQVSAHQFQIPQLAERDTGLFLHHVTSWGWGSWKHAWDRYDPGATGWEELTADRELRRRFDVGRYPYSDMLLRQMEGRVDSWAIRWWWTVFRAGGMSLFPPRSLVANIGYGDSATHYRLGSLRRGRSEPLVTETAVPRLPGEATVLPGDDALFAAAVGATTMRSQRARTIVRRAKARWDSAG